MQPTPNQQAALPSTKLFGWQLIKAVDDANDHSLRDIELPRKKEVVAVKRVWLQGYVVKQSAALSLSAGSAACTFVLDDGTSLVKVALCTVAPDIVVPSTYTLSPLTTAVWPPAGDECDIGSHGGVEVGCYCMVLGTVVVAINPLQPHNDRCVYVIADVVRVLDRALELKGGSDPSKSAVAAEAAWNLEVARLSMT